MYTQINVPNSYSGGEVHKASEIELLVKVDVAVAVVLYTKSSMKWELG